ncbi:lasso peptide biosynthesis PqqD family chaperone [Kitasatospora sp. NPDC097691]|uniref:lasso peptide biosynthesis PqqD family chaperone n=1 Tax=Kitasatospora sp. NPDC097691 TaxID=3157231 RepID=UPI00332C9F05
MTIALPRHVLATETESGLVLLDERGGRYWQLNGSGATALKLLLAGTSTQDTAEELTRGSAVGSDQAAADIAALLNALSQAGLVVVS